MENKEPKDPGRIAAEKNLQNITKKQEKQKRLVAKIKKFQKKTKMKFQKKTIKKDHFHKQILSVVSIVVSLAGLYYKRKELMSFVRPPRERRVDRTEEITEEDLERLRESHREAESNLKDSKWKPMD